jgi:hypothetical protein
MGNPCEARFGSYLSYHSVVADTGVNYTHGEIRHVRFAGCLPTKEHRTSAARAYPCIAIGSMESKFLRMNEGKASISQGKNAFVR